MAKKNEVDIGLLLVIFALLCAGIVMVFSASYPYALFHYNDGYYFLKRQFLWAVLGVPVMLFMANYNYHRLEKHAVPLLIASAALLLAVFIPGVGKEINGSRRWIGAGFMQFQPSEVAKLAIIIFLASSLSQKKDILKSFIKGLVPYLAIIGAIAGIIVIEPHLSSTVIVFLVGCIILFAAGAKISHFIALGASAFTGLIGLIITEPYRLQRLETFMNPWKDPTDTGYQITQSLMAIGSGGLIGLGLGMSRQKQLYLPEPHNDFVFSIIGEELGFLGAALVLILFLIFIWKGIKIAVYAQDMLGSLLATGITSLIALQAIINIAVVTSSMPNTGQPLPFFSYGGTSLMFLLISVGILLNISRYTNYER